MIIGFKEVMMRNVKGERIEGWLLGFFRLWIDGGNVHKTFRSLNEREAKVLGLRFGLTKARRPHTQSEIAKMFKVTKERIRQIEAKAFRKLAHPSRRKFAIPERQEIYHEFLEKLWTLKKEE